MFEKTVKKFLKGATWLTNDHEPAKVMLLALAQALDGGDFTAALVAQYRLIFNGLMDERPKDDESTDDDDLLLAPEDN